MLDFTDTLKPATPRSRVAQLATALFVEAMRSEGLRLGNDDDIKRISLRSISAAKSLSESLREAGLLEGPAPTTGPTTGSTTVPEGATNQQEADNRKVAEILSEDAANVDSTEFGSISLEDNPLAFNGPGCPFCGCTDLLHDGSLSERLPGQREACEYVTCSACRAQGPSVSYTPYVDGKPAENEAARLWRLGLPRGSVAHHATQIRDLEVERDAATTQAEAMEAERDAARAALKEMEVESIAGDEIAGLIDASVIRLQSGAYRVNEVRHYTYGRGFVKGGITAHSADVVFFNQPATTHKVGLGSLVVVQDIDRKATDGVSISDDGGAS